MYSVSGVAGGKDGFGGFADEDIPLGHPASDPWSSQLADERRSFEGGPGAGGSRREDGEGYYDDDRDGGYGASGQAERHARQPSYNAYPAPSSFQQTTYDHPSPPAGGASHGRQTSYEPGQPFPLHEQRAYGQQQQQQHAQQGQQEYGREEYPHQPGRF